MTKDRRCPQCRKTFPLTPDFWFVSRRDARGQPLVLMSWCKECKRAYERERHRRRMQEDPEYAERWRERIRRNRQLRMERDPERERARLRAWEERVRKDPLRMRQRRESGRMAYYLRTENKPRRPYQRQIDAVGEESMRRRMPIGPFAAVLRPVVLEKFGSPEKAAFAWGAHARTLRAYINEERETVTLDKAERLLKLIDVPIEDVWPDAFRDGTKPLILGEAPGKTPGKPIGGKLAKRLAELLKLDGDDPREALLEFFDLDNLIKRYPGQKGKGAAFPMDEARKAAENRPLSGRVVLLGRRLASIYDVPFWGLWTPKPGARVVAIPHPSGLNHLYNDPEVRRNVGRVLREAVA
jgi:hypothetical protein